MTRRRNHLPRATHPTVAKWCIWSVENQTWLTGQVRNYIWGATALAAFVAVTGLFPLEAILWAVLFSGMLICTALWLLIQMRRIWLLNIEGPELRRQALAAMIGYLKEINCPIPPTPRERQAPEIDPEARADRSHSS